MCRDLPSGQAFCVQRQHDLVNIGQAPLSFLDDLRFERAFPVARYIALDVADVAVAGAVFHLGGLEPLVERVAQCHAALR